MSLSAVFIWFSIESKQLQVPEICEDKGVNSFSKELIIFNKSEEEAKSLNIFERLAVQDRTAIKDCIDAYGNFIWNLARKFTVSTAEAEAAVQGIFIDIWQSAARLVKYRYSEKLLILLVARRRLDRDFPVTNGNR